MSPSVDQPCPSPARILTLPSQRSVSKAPHEALASAPFPEAILNPAVTSSLRYSSHGIDPFSPMLESLCQCPPHPPHPGCSWRPDHGSVNPEGFRGLSSHLLSAARFTPPGTCLSSPSVYTLPGAEGSPFTMRHRVLDTLTRTSPSQAMTLRHRGALSFPEVTQPVNAGTGLEPRWPGSWPLYSAVSAEVGTAVYPAQNVLLRIQ